MLALFFILLGLMLILLEFYLPGAVMGILGGMSILIAVLLFASQTSSWLAVLLLVMGLAFAIGLMIHFALWKIAHAKPEHSIYLADDQEGYVASTYDKAAIGKKGIVTADLKPGGYILVEGCQHPAISVSGYLVKGEKVVVIGGQEQSLMVKKD